MSGEFWQVKEGWSFGYFGGNRDQIMQQLDSQLGPGQWRVGWRLANGEVLDYLREFYENFVAGYTLHFLNHPDEAKFLTENYAYAFDKDLISREEAFDPQAYFNRPGFVNQIHHAGINIALERFLGWRFRGQNPIQVREGKPDTPQETWRAGWKWSPGRIKTPRPGLIPDVSPERRWNWEEGSIEHRYQAAKVILIKTINR